MLSPSGFGADLPNVDQYNIRYFFTSPRSLFMVCFSLFSILFMWNLSLAFGDLAAKEGAQFLIEKFFAHSLTHLRGF